MEKVKILQIKFDQHNCKHFFIFHILEKYIIVALTTLYACIKPKGTTGSFAVVRLWSVMVAEKTENNDDSQKKSSGPVGGMWIVDMRQLNSIVIIRASKETHTSTKE